jgi:3-oxoacyl-[acyl-carrier-protein] synthase II
MTLKRVVVTGMGALTPIGNTAEQYWNALIAGTSGAAPITHFDASKFKTQFACEVKDFDVLDHIDRKEARKMDPFSQYAVVVCEEAIQDSGILEGKIDKDRVGVILASGIGGITTFQEEILQFGKGDGTPRFNPFFIPKMISDIAPGHVSIRHGFRGPNYSTVSACASSTNAIIDGYNMIQLDRADIIVTGGSEACINEAGVGGFNALHAMSQRNDDPSTASRPFDANRDGFVLGEGGASLILEEYEHAKARGAKIYAEMIGWGLSADAHHITAPDPEGKGVMLVMRNALRDAGIAPSDLDYINVHGTSTPLGDGAELKAIQEVFGKQAYNLSISATKSMTGHLLGAAGAIEAAATILSIKHDIVPPTINNFDRDETLDPNLDLTLNKATYKTVNCALSNTFGFGGHNASVIFKKGS